jgi:hypothetical protein
MTNVSENTAAAAASTANSTTTKATAAKSLKGIKMTKGNNARLLILDLNDLTVQRADWEKGAFKTSNDQLYVILGRCLDIYTQMKDDLPQRKNLNDELRSAGIKFTNATNLATKIVRYVFRNDRTRSFSYARTIMAAVDAKIDGMKLPKWIREGGGVEDIRRANKVGISPAQLARQHAEVATSELAKQKALVEAFKAPAELQPSGEAAHRFSLALVRKNSDGTSSIVYGSDNEALIVKMLTAAGKHFVAKKSQEAEIKKKLALKKTRQEIVSAAA